MNYDSNYDYKIISEYEFDSKYLLSLNDGSKYNIINDDIEEIISSCTQFDSLYKYKAYYKIKNKFCFVKYKFVDDVDFAIDSNDNDKVKEMLENI